MKSFQNLFSQNFHFNFGTICPKQYPYTIWLGWYIPRRRILFRTAGAVCQGCITLPFTAACPWLTPPAVLFSGGVTGVSFCRAAFPKIGKGRWDRVKHQGGFTYKFYQQPLWAHDERGSPLREARPAEGTGRIALCGVFFIGGDYLCFLLLEVLQRAKLIC